MKPHIRNRLLPSSMFYDELQISSHYAIIYCWGQSGLSWRPIEPIICKNRHGFVVLGLQASISDAWEVLPPLFMNRPNWDFVKPPALEDQQAEIIAMCVHNNLGLNMMGNHIFFRELRKTRKSLTLKSHPSSAVSVCQQRSRPQREDVLVLRRDWSEVQSPSEWSSPLFPSRRPPNLLS